MYYLGGVVVGVVVCTCNIWCKPNAHMRACGCRLMLGQALMRMCVGLGGCVRCMCRFGAGLNVLVGAG
jgi:hypothetical protein